MSPCSGWCSTYGATKFPREWVAWRSTPSVPPPHVRPLCLFADSCARATSVPPGGRYNNVTMAEMDALCHVCNVDEAEGDLLLCEGRCGTAAHTYVRTLGWTPPPPPPTPPPPPGSGINASVTAAAAAA